MALAVRQTARVTVGRARAPLAAPLRPAVRPCIRGSRPAAYKKPEPEEITETVKDTITNAGAFIKGKWEQTEDKPAAVIVTLGAILVLSALSGVVNAIDRIPVVSDLIELVGVGVTGWFTYRYLVFGPDREELVQNIQTFLKKVYGK